jgi:hypothetical protein
MFENHQMQVKLRLRDPFAFCACTYACSVMASSNCISQYIKLLKMTFALCHCCCHSIKQTHEKSREGKRACYHLTLRLQYLLLHVKEDYFVITKKDAKFKQKKINGKQIPLPPLL